MCMEKTLVASGERGVFGMFAPFFFPPFPLPLKTHLTAKNLPCKDLLAELPALMMDHACLNETTYAQEPSSTFFQMHYSDSWYQKSFNHHLSIP